MSAALRVCLTAFAVIWLAVAGWAQDAGTASGIDFENWANTVARAETAIERDAASDQAFAVLRGDIVLFRAQFDAAQELLSLKPTPLNPAYWQPALADLSRAASAIGREQSVLRQATRWQELRDNLPVVALLSVLGLTLMARGRYWAGAIVGRLQRMGARGFGIWRFVVSLLRIALPVAGLFALITAVRMSGYFGPRAGNLLAMLPVMGALLLAFRWVAERVFSRDEDEALLLLQPFARTQARAMVFVITLMLLIEAVLRTLLDNQRVQEATPVVLLFPVYLIMAICLFRLGRLLSRYKPSVEDGEDEVLNPTFRRVVRWLGRGGMFVAVVAPLIMAAGYANAAQALLPPYVTSLALLGFVMVLQRFATEVYGALTGKGVQARDALLPVLMGFVLLVLATPFLALIWGARDLGGQNAIVSGLGYLGIFLAALIAITAAGIDLSSLAIVAGALSVGIGFGLQNIVSNFVSGIILLIERPISEGDWIEVGGKMGYVRDISVRSTRIETFDRTDVIVPNADLVSGTVTNYTRGNTVGRVIVPVGVAYGSDTRKVHDVLLGIAEAQPMVLANPAPSVLFVNLGADSLDFEVRCFLRDVNFTMTVKNEINHQIVQRFAEEGIEIPFVQRDLWIRNPDALLPTTETSGK